MSQQEFEKQWIVDYIAAIPKRRSILAQVESRWRDKSLAALNAWRYSNNEQQYKFMSFCDQVVEALKTEWGKLP